jgi:hypothetical protein
MRVPRIEASDMTSPTPHRRPPRAAILIIIPLAVALVLTLFAWPSSRLEPRDVPVGVAGSAAIEQQLAARDGAFEVHRYADEAAARQAIEDREVYGAFVATPEGPKVLTATAASATVAQLLNHAAAEAKAPVEDVVTASPATAGLAASVLPLVLAGILTGLAGAALGTTALQRAGLVAAGSIAAGLTATAIIQSWLDVVGGDWLVNAGTLSLTVFAIAAVVAGMESLIGKAGAALAALTMVLIGNPFSGVATGPEMLPTGAGWLGQLLPPGAGGNLLRSTGLFDGAAAGGHVAVLAVWALAGLALLFASALRGRKTAPAVAPATA